ncbi:MAG: DUF4382 domain-containing protein [Chitinivibrionales bacterium]|nr:DUF4382 domain-containing protein [Chitinivibrionales bacterium]
MAAFIFLYGCSSEKNSALVFRANGEDFVRQGFIDKQGWAIAFDTVLVHLSDIAAYNKKEGLRAELQGNFAVDLAAGDDNAIPVKVGTVDNVAAGNYQSLKFKVTKATAGEYRGSSIVMTGKAIKDSLSIPFIIKINETMTFTCTEGYVGDEIKGIVKEDSVADVEMTFHFDHIFGDNDAPMDNHINSSSVGFDFFYQYRDGGKVAVSQSELKQDDEYETFVRALWSLGHCGEGHCEVSEQSTELHD